MKNLLRIFTFTTLGILMTSFSYAQYSAGAHNEIGPQTNANSANHAATTAYGYHALQNATGGARITSVGAFSGESNTTGNHNSFYGHTAGRNNTTGGFNSYFGDATGLNNTSGGGNSAFGSIAQISSNTASECTALGFNAGSYNVTGNRIIAIGKGTLSNYGNNTNTVFTDKNDVIAIGNDICGLAEGDGSELILIGREAGMHYKGGDRNILIGASVGRNMGGNRNVMIGTLTGYNNVGDGNIFIGDAVALSWTETTNYNNHLFIGNEQYSEFLVGDMANGKLGINTNTPQNALDVCGKVRSDEVIIENNWCDYVFYKNYRLPSLKEEAQHIEEKGHLIGFQSEEEMNGEIHLSDVTKRQQVKIEEVMLHLIEMEKRLNTLTEENAQLKQEIKELQRN